MEEKVSRLTCLTLPHYLTCYTQSMAGYNALNTQTSFIKGAKLPEKSRAHLYFCL